MNLKLHDYFSVASDRHTTAIFQAVTAGMEPFHLKQIDVYLDFDIDYHEYRVLAGAVLLNGYTISYSQIVNAWDLADYPDREMIRVAEAMFLAFRNREEWPVHDHITLGEN